MPVSNDNQDFKNDNEKGNDKKDPAKGSESEKPNPKPIMTSDDLKGKKVDGDPEKESDKPADI